MGSSALGHLAESALLGRSREADGNHIYGAFGHDFVTKTIVNHVDGPYQSPMEATKNCYENRGMLLLTWKINIIPTLMMKVVDMSFEMQL